MDIAREARYRQTPLVFHVRIKSHTSVSTGNLLRRPEDDDTASVPCAHRLFVPEAPAWGVRRKVVNRVNRQANELVGQHAASIQARRPVVIVADGNAGTRAYIVVGVEVEVADRACVMVPLQVAPDLVVAIAKPLRKQAALGVEQQTRRLHGTSRNYYQIGKLLLEMAI